MALVDYPSHFWGEKHIGYHVLYENLKKSEDTVAEIAAFLKERINLEDDLLKFLHKSLNRVNNYITVNGAFVDSWRLTKGTLELWTEIQMSVLKNLGELSRDVVRYHDDLAKKRKRFKDGDTLAKETYNQRYSEVSNLKSDTANTKEYLKAKNKLSKAHDEYRSYVEKYAHVRDNFEEKMLKAARVFQEHDQSHLNQLKRFFVQLARSLEDGHSAIAQVTTDYRENLERVDVEEIMLRFIEDKGTGSEKPQSIKWSESDELPADLEIISHLSSSAPSSSSNSAVVNPPTENNIVTVNDLLGLDDSWGTGSNFKSSHNNVAQAVQSHGLNFDGGSGDSESECQKQGPSNSFSSSYMPQQFSSWLGRQKLSNWRKKTASQSNLPTATSGNSGMNCKDQSGSEQISAMPNFSMSYNEMPLATGAQHKCAGNFMRRYQKKGSTKGSTNDVSTLGLATEDPRSGELSNDSTPKAFAPLPPSSSSTLIDPLEQFGPPPPLPTSEPPPLLMDDISFTFRSDPQKRPSLPEIDADGFTIPRGEQIPSSGKNRWSSCSSSDSEDEHFQTSKIRSLQIKPLNESQAKINVSVDELRNAVGHIALPRSSTFDKDPWSHPSGENDGLVRNANAPIFSKSHNTGSFKQPLRAAHTGDEHLRRKFTDFDSLSSYSNSTNFNNFDFTQSTMIPGGGYATMAAGSNIARARPRSHTPTILPFATSSLKQNVGSMGSLSNLTNTPSSDFATNSSDSPIFPSQATGANDRERSSSSPLTLAFAPTNGLGGLTQKIPVAMATNEYLHVWLKGGLNSIKSEVKVFGTLLISLPTSIIPQLSAISDIGPFKFSLTNSTKIKSVSPNKNLINWNSSLEPSKSTYSFAMNRISLIGFLSEQLKANPSAAFHNADIVRYELQQDDAFQPPLTFSTRWQKLSPEQTQIQVDYRLLSDGGAEPLQQNALLNITFGTKINGGLRLKLVSSMPEAKWIEDKGVLSWTLTELSRHGECTGSLKAIIGHMSGSCLPPANTWVQFQILDASVSKATICLENEDNYSLSLVRRKVIAGKYFCEPDD